MTLHTFSRRRLLGGLLAGLAAWLCPRSPRAAAPRRTGPTVSRQPRSAVLGNTYSYDYNTGLSNGEFGLVTTYVYNGDGPLFSAPEGTTS